MDDFKSVILVSQASRDGVTFEGKLKVFTLKLLLWHLVVFADDGDGFGINVIPAEAFQ